MDDTFGGYHPLVNFIFFVGAIVFGMFFTHPVLLVISIFSSALYYLLLRGKKGVKPLCAMAVLFVALSAINALFNASGRTVLFTYFGGRHFTLEALLYGCVTGSMFVSILLWFSCYNLIMTSDKFIYLFGRCIPALSLILCMVLRLVPNFQAKAAAVIGARKCVGRAPSNGDEKQKLKKSMDVLSVLTSWALEGAIVAADSMRSRGYGSGRRTNFSIYKFCARDYIFLGILLLSAAVITAGAVFGGVKAEYFPAISFPSAGAGIISASIGYGAFLLLPSIIHIWEEATWRILRSKI